eukprot:Rmarinus@m.27901
MQLPQLIPPFRYAIVEENISRGAYPSLKNFRFLRRLNLRTILSFTPDLPNRDLVEFCEHEGIDNYHFECEHFQEEVTVTPKQVTQALQLMLDEENQPLFIHCRDGGHVTGLVVMCLRKLQNWNLSVTFSEFCRFVKDNEISRDEALFVESYVSDVVLPKRVPNWFTATMSRKPHPSHGLPPTGIDDETMGADVEPLARDTANIVPLIDTTRVPISSMLEGLALEGLVLTTRRAHEVVDNTAPLQHTENPASWLRERQTKGIDSPNTFVTTGMTHGSTELPDIVL